MKTLLSYKIDGKFSLTIPFSSLNGSGRVGRRFVRFLKTLKYVGGNFFQCSFLCLFRRTYTRFFVQNFNQIVMNDTQLV